jgi:hypothetical protein
MYKDFRIPGSDEVIMNLICSEYIDGFKRGWDCCKVYVESELLDIESVKTIRNIERPEVRKLLSEGDIREVTYEEYVPLGFKVNSDNTILQFLDWLDEEYIENTNKDTEDRKESGESEHE